MDTNEKSMIGAAPIQIKAAQRLQQAEMEAYQMANDTFSEPMDSLETRDGE